MANNAQTIDRIYRIPDTRMLQRSNTMLAGFTADQADFQAFDAGFDAGFKTDWAAELLLAQDIASDETVRDEQRTLTANVELAMKAGYQKWNEVKYFIMKAFPDSKPIQDEFGADDFRKARESQDRLFAFLENLHTKAQKYKTQLIGVKYSQPQIDDIKAVATALRTADSAQDDFKKSAPVLTEERIKTLNEAYQRLVRISTAAEFIYSESPARRSKYVIDESVHYDPAGEYAGIIAAGVAVEAAHVHYDAARTLLFENTGTTTLQFWLNGGGLGTQGTVMDIIATQNSGTLTMADLDVSGNHIIVKNTSNAVAGAYKVTIGS